MAQYPSFSLYIHVPFCARKCRYCDFYSQQPAGDTAKRLFEAMREHWQLARNIYRLETATVETVYFGGGTPSLLQPCEWMNLSKMLKEEMSISTQAECSIECNPDSFTPSKAAQWLSSGCNRIVVGVQSLNDDALRFLGRRHDSAQALAVLADSALKDFNSVGADIIYALPGQNPAQIRDTVRRILDVGSITHLSAYELTLHPGTPLYEQRQQLELPGEDAVVDMMNSIRATAAEYGLEQYEISNYARPGYRSRHNMAYWTHAPYLGLGPSAHSFLAPRRTANVADVERYIDMIARGALPLEFSEQLDSESIASEIIFLALRTTEGIDENRFARLTGKPFVDLRRKPLLDRLVREGLLSRTHPFWRPTPSGIMLADAMARELA